MSERRTLVLLYAMIVSTQLFWAGMVGSATAAQQGKEWTSFLFRVSAAGDLKGVTNALEKGANVNAQDPLGRTALHYAAGKGRDATVRLLLAKGADVNARSKRGKTVLGIAERRENKEIPDLLRAHDAMNSQALAIRREADKVAARGGELLFRLEDGRILSRRSTPRTPGGADLFFDGVGNVVVHYTFIDFADPWFVVGEQYMEGAGTTLINRKSGVFEHITGYCDLSPDKTHCCVMQYAGMDPCFTEIWKLTPTGIVLQWQADTCGTLLFRWTQTGGLEITDYNVIKGSLRYDGHVWRCLGPSDLCENLNESTKSKDRLVVHRSNCPPPSPLIKAAREGDMDRVRELVKSGADPNSRWCRYTLLGIAAGRGHLEVVKFLLDSGAEIDGHAPLGGTALKCAAEHGRMDVMRFLLDQGADVNAKDANRWTTLFFAASEGRWDAVLFLLEKGADLTVDLRTALAKAARDGHMGMVRLLLDRGTKIKAKPGWPPLQMAAGEGRLEVVKLLLDRGANVNAQDEDGRTALMCAAIRGHRAVAKLLLDRGAGVNTRDGAGWTALMDAAWGGDPKLVELLLDKGADVRAVGPYGWTALKTADRCGHKEIVRMLKAKGAKH